MLWRVPTCPTTLSWRCDWPTINLLPKMHMKEKVGVKVWRAVTHVRDGVEVRWGQVRSGEARWGQAQRWGRTGVLWGRLRPAHTSTPPPPVLYVACLFTNHIMQTVVQLDVSTNARFSGSAPVVDSYTVSVQNLLALPLRAATVSHRSTDDLNWLLNLSCCRFVFLLCCVSLEIFTANIVFMILMCRILIVNRKLPWTTQRNDPFWGRWLDDSEFTLFCLHAKLFHTKSWEAKRSSDPWMGFN